MLIYARFFLHRRTIIMIQLLAFLILTLADQPTLAQAHIAPVKPPGAGWVHVDSWCAGLPPRPTYCPPGQRGQHWMWGRPAGQRGANGSIAYYETEITYPSWKTSPDSPPLVTAVNCASWEKRRVAWKSVEADKGWEPINPRSLGDQLAKLACNQGRRIR